MATTDPPLPGLKPRAGEVFAPVVSEVGTVHDHRAGLVLHGCRCVVSDQRIVFESKRGEVLAVGLDEVAGIKTRLLSLEILRSSGFGHYVEVSCYGRSGPVAALYRDALRKYNLS